MKKLLVLLVVFALCFGTLVGCGSTGDQSPAGGNAPSSSAPEAAKPSAEPSPAPSVKPSPSPSAKPSPSVAPSPAPSVNPSPSAAPSPAPSVAPSPAPSVAPSPAPSVEPSPAPSAEPSPAPSETPAEDAYPYAELSFYDVHNETTFTFDKAFLVDDMYLHLKPGSSYTAKADSGDEPWIYGEYAMYLDFADCWTVGIDSFTGPKCWVNVSSGPVDEIFEKLNNDFGENCDDNMRPLPLIQYGWEDFYILFLDE